MDYRGVSTSISDEGEGEGTGVGAGLSKSHHALRSTEIEGGRGRALLLASAASVQELDGKELLALQLILEHGTRWGYWETPRKWSPSTVGTSRMNIDLRARIVHYLSEMYQHRLGEPEKSGVRFHGALESEELHQPSWATGHVSCVLDGAVLTLMRYLVLLRIGPVGIGRAKNVSLDPSTVRGIAYSYLPQLLAIATSKWLADIASGDSQNDATLGALLIQHGYLNRVQQDDLELLSESQRRYVHLEIRRMRVLAQRGYWSDVPEIEEGQVAVTPVAGPASPVQAERTIDSHLPLPDEYVAAMGSRSIWLIQDLAPNLLVIGTMIRSIWLSTEDRALLPRSVASRRMMELGQFLSGYVWRDGTGHVIREPPFLLRLTQRGKKSKQMNGRRSSLTIDQGDARTVGVTAAEERGAGAKAPEIAVDWPPRTFGDIMSLMSNVQMAHFFVVALSIGARKSEALDLGRDCVQYSRNGMTYASGKTFKLVQRHDGELRDWVLPALAAQALEQQARLVSLAEEIGPLVPDRSRDDDVLPEGAARHLWAQLAASKDGDRRAPLQAIGKALVAYAETLGLDIAPGGQRLRPHRLRKTVARLVALALTQAPKVLMNVFGHKSIEMTLYYILSSKDLRPEIEQVSRELRVMRAKDVVETMVREEDAAGEGLLLGGYGGPAALTVDRAIGVQMERLSRRGEKWGADSAIELAELLTLQGEAWQLVRPGVICTKFPGTEFGPCNKNKGHPEPSSCQTHCNHRLEEAFLREDVDGVVRDAIQAYEEAVSSGNQLGQAFWAGQIRINIGRFEDLRMKWMRETTVQRVVTELPVGDSPA